MLDTPVMQFEAFRIASNRYVIAKDSRQFERDSELKTLDKSEFV